MRAIRRSLVPCGRCALAFVAWATVLAVAQHRALEDAGGGKKIETYYDTADRVTQQRTLGPDGKILAKVQYEYLAGYPASPANVIQQTTTSYATNGKISQVTRQSFDENTNFTEELIRVFDESGKQIGGHTLTHNPWNGAYACADWNVVVQAYRRVDCPAGEESSGGTETVKKFTRREVLLALDMARAVAEPQQKRAASSRADAGANRTTNHDIGIVLPASVRPGERISGIVTERASEYDKIREVRVTRVALPFELASETSLAGWNFETLGETAQPADGPITLIVPRDSSELKITLGHRDNPTRSVTAVLHFPKAARAALSPRSFEGEALCLKGQLCPVRGPFSGDSRETFAAFENRPAKIVAETQHTALIAVPETTEPGSRPLFISERHKMVVLPVVVGEFTIKNNGRELQAGQTLIVYPALDGPAEIPDELWTAANHAAENHRQARELMRELNLPRKSNDKEEERRESQAERPSKEKEKSGKILLVVKNDAPQQLSLRGSKNQMLVFHLNYESFRMGRFQFTLVIEALKSGPVKVTGYVIPFLATVPGQEFEANASALGL